jgi:hypothetical protein
MISKPISDPLKAAYVAKHKDRVVPPPNKKKLGEMQKWELDKELIRQRILQTQARTKGYNMDLARVREKLIQKELVIKQLQYLMIGFRQKILTIPMTYARKLQRKEDLKEIHRILTQMTHQLLNELADLPLKAVDPNWLAKLEDEEEDNVEANK